MCDKYAKAKYFRLLFQDIRAIKCFLEHNEYEITYKQLLHNKILPRKQESYKILGFRRC